MKNTKTVQSYRDISKEKNRSTLKNDETGFTRPVYNKEKNPECKPENGVNSPWDFRCPEYDQRSSNFVNAGTHYGVGHRQPIGHAGDPKVFVDALPVTRHNTLQDDDGG